MPGEEEEEKYFKVGRQYSDEYAEKLTYEERERQVCDRAHWRAALIKVLQHKDTTVCPLYVAIINHNEADVARVIKERHADPSAIYSSGTHPKFSMGRCWPYLSYAVFENYLPVIKVLLEDIRVVRAIYKREYQPLRWGFDSSMDTDIECLKAILEVVGHDANQPSRSELQKVYKAIDAIHHVPTLRRNYQILQEMEKFVPHWLTIEGIAENKEKYGWISYIGSQQIIT